MVFNGFVIYHLYRLMPFQKDSWIYFAITAVVLSQILIINSWQDAKFGTIANVIILLVTIFGLFQIKFKNEYKHEVKIGFEESKKYQTAF